MFQKTTGQETVERVAASFRIPNASINSLTLQTSSLLVCRGESVIIDSSAYPFIFNHLFGDIQVTITADDDPISTGGLAGQQQQPLRTRIPSIPGRSPSPPQATREVVQSPHSTSPPQALPSTTNVAQTNRQPPPPSSPSPQRSVDPLFQFDERLAQEEVEEVEKLFFTAEGIVKTPSSSPRKKKPKFKAASATSSQKQETKVKKAELSQPEEFTAKSQQESQTSIDAPVPVKKESQSTPVDEDSRFDVIIFGPAANQNAQFKLRGKNTVKKVLTAACKNFNIDNTRAHLVHSIQVQTDSDDGEAQSHEFRCQPEDTIALCGVTAGSKLFIRLDPPGEVDHQGYATESDVNN